MAASRRKQSAAAPQSVIRDFGTQKAPRPKRGILRPLSFGRVGCPDADFLRRPQLSRLAIEITIPLTQAAKHKTSTTSLRRKGISRLPQEGRPSPRRAMGDGRGVLTRVGAAPGRARCSASG
jgi:hypothetical protein